MYRDEQQTKKLMWHPAQKQLKRKCDDMNNQKERIMDLMRKGIITESEAIELLEKAGLNQETVSGDETGHW